MKLTSDQRFALEFMGYILRKNWWILLIAGIEAWGIIATLTGS